MNEQDRDIVARVAKAAVSQATQELQSRVHTLTSELAVLRDLVAQKAERGEKGDRGEKGEQGPQGERGAAGERGADGQNAVVSHEDILTVLEGNPAFMREIVADYLKANPPPRGEKGEAGRDGADGKDGERGERGEKGIDGKDGSDGKDGRDGRDGRHGKDGRDGIDGADGKDALDIEFVGGIEEGRSYRKGTWALHRNGIHRYDGDAWMTLIDGEYRVDEELTDGHLVRTVEYASGKKQVFRHAVSFPGYRGVWKEGEYPAGAIVTHDGSMWIALKATKVRPGDYAKEWQLCVKRGRNGASGLTVDDMRRLYGLEPPK